MSTEEQSCLNVGILQAQRFCSGEICRSRHFSGKKIPNGLFTGDFKQTQRKHFSFLGPLWKKGKGLTNQPLFYGGK